MRWLWRWLDGCRPETIFVLAVGLFGALCAVVTPPTMGPDEPAHWFRVYMLTRLNIVPVTADRPGHYKYGGDIAQGLTWFAGQEPFRDLRSDPKARFQPRVLKDALDRSVDPARAARVEIPNTTLYSPVGYLTATAFAAVPVALRASPLAFVYAARLGTLVGYLAVGWLAIRVTPVCKWPAVLALSSPMGMFLAGCVSADPMTTGLAFLATGLVLRAVLAPGRASVWLAVAVAAALAGVALCKSAYVPMVCLTWAVRPWKWGGWVRATCVWLVPVVAVVIWSGVTHPQGVRQRGFDPVVQADWVRHHPIQYTRVFLRAVNDNWFNWIDGSVGVLGWLDAPIFAPAVIGYYLALLWLTVAYGEPDGVPVAPRVMAVAAIVGSTWLIVLASYLVWNPTGAAQLEGVQGRYFLPLLLPGSVMLHRRNGYTVRPAWMAVLLACIGGCTLWTLARRYYLPA